MNQLALVLPLSRRTDPDTSHAAADRVHDFRVRHEGLIFGAISNAGARGATMKEIAQATGLEPVQVGRRLGAMGGRGVIARRELGPIGAFERRGGCAVWRVA